MEAVDDATFSTAVLKAEKLVLVDFWAPWCGPCKAQTPVLERLSKVHPDVSFVKVNVDEAKQVAGTYGIRSIPTLALFYGGKVMLAKAGLQSMMELDGLLRAAKLKTSN
jgi:thioredoxin 1